MFASRVESLKPSPTLAISAMAKKMQQEGKDVIDFSLGEPDLNTPEAVKLSAINAIKQNYTKYTAVSGIVPLREAISAHLKQRFSFDYGVNQIIVSTGAKQSIFNAFMATLNSGDEVILPAPTWVSYKDIVMLFGGKAIVVPTSMESNFKITPQQLQNSITPKTKWLLLNSPSNPTGAIYTQNELLQIASVLRENPHVHIMSDDIYEEVVYDNIKCINILTIAPDLKTRLLLINGLSKSYCMTGWRLGFAAGNADLIAIMANLQSQSTSNPTSITQYAALQAYSNYDENHIKELRAIYQRRRDMALDALNACPYIKTFKPDGAFYFFIDVKQLVNKSYEGKVLSSCTDIAHYLLKDALVAVVPGSAFEGPGHIRISFAVTEKILAEGVRRIVQSLNLLGANKS